MYALMLLIGTILGCLMLSETVQGWLKDDNWFCQGLEKSVKIKCQIATGFQAVYR